MAKDGIVGHAFEIMLVLVIVGLMFMNYVLLCSGHVYTSYVYILLLSQACIYNNIYVGLL